MERRVVVTGIGLVTPIGLSKNESWNALINGKSGISQITRFDTSNLKVTIGGEVKNFDPTTLIAPKEVKKMDTFIHYALHAGHEAMMDSGIQVTDEQSVRFGCIVGSGLGGLPEIENAKLKLEQTNRTSPFFIPMVIGNMAPGHLAITHGLRGPNLSIATACASGLHAIGEAYHYIKHGLCDTVLTGGAEAAISPLAISGFSAMKALSTRNESPTKASRPFDKDRDGFVLGEGAASLILEEYESAKARGARIYGEILGAGMTADAYHITAPHPEGLGAQNVMKIALRDAGLTPDQLDYVNVHGTSTPLGDVSESKAILNVFGEHAYKLNISSTKSMTGHLLGAAGAVEALACLSAINTGIIPPTINHFTDDEQFDAKLNFTFNTAQHREVKYALSNTFGFGGHNASVIMGKCE